MAFEFLPILDYGLERAADVFTRGFSDYFVKIAATPATLLGMARADSVDLTCSPVILQDGTAVGAALIARRGWTCRLAGMAIVPEARRHGAGRAAVERVLAEAQARGERVMELEVIEQNEPAVKLYEACGFQRVRRLVGFSGAGTGDPAGAAALEEVDVRAVARQVTVNAVADLPWQLSGETQAQAGPPVVGYRLGSSWVVLANLAAPQVTIRALVTERAAQGRGGGAALLRAVMAKHPGKEWRISAVWPEELGDVFVQAGLTRTALSQWQMRRTVGGGEVES